MGWGVVIELMLEHDYYAPHMPPVTVRPTDAARFAKSGLLLRQSGALVFVLAENAAEDLPATVELGLEVQNTDVIAVTQGGDWSMVPQLTLMAGTDRAVLEDARAATVPQRPGRQKLAQITAEILPQVPRRLKLRFKAMASHWAYHVIGPGSDDVHIEDPEGAVEFDPLGTVDLPDGTPAHVLRSRAPLPARARPNQRFSLTRPGPFGPRILIPVLPAPQPLFASVPAPDGAGALIQSDIFVSIY
ncbi:hypothetical protein [Roseobacter weihaiensis]|uniref:hypothetical protein n=1 Tax=Roseobacter weihaiensis TaxID=2763262 RepID=UPI001D0B5227|nr:hypothetical protein [Roseobacter sp. H9]